MAQRNIIIAGALVAAAVVAYFAWTHPKGPSGDTQPSAVTASSRAATGSQPRSDLAQGDRPAAAVLATKAMAFEDLKQRAKRGDPVAQRQLAQIYDSCFIANVRPEYFLSGYEQQAKSLKDASKASKMVQVARERAAECRGVDGGDVIPVELIKGWFEQAARNGDPGAQAMIYALNQKVLDNAEANHFIQNIAGSKDPAAVFLMGEFAGGKGLDAADATYDDIVGGPTTGYAWMVVGCRMGYDCGPSSDLMGTMCLHMQACGDDDFEAFVRSGLRSDDEVEALDRQIEEISRLVDLR